MISNPLQQLLMWGVPKMTDEGAARFHHNLEAAIRNVVTQAFDPQELAAFHVTEMIVPLKEIHRGTS